MKADLKSIVADNVRTLLGLQEGEKGLARLINLGVANGNAQRVLGAETSVGLKLLEEVAGKLRRLHHWLEPWHLCLPGLDPRNRPLLGGGAVAPSTPPGPRWPFGQLDAQVFDALPPHVHQAAENLLLALLAAMNILPRPGTAPEPRLDPDAERLVLIYRNIRDENTRRIARALMEQFVENGTASAAPDPAPTPAPAPAATGPRATPPAARTEKRGP